MLEPKHLFSIFEAIAGVVAIVLLVRHARGRS